jgi:hypothetical protein
LKTSREENVGRLKPKWEDDTKMDVPESVCEVRDWIHLV